MVTKKTTTKKKTTAKKAAPKTTANKKDPREALKASKTASYRTDLPMKDDYYSCRKYEVTAAYRGENGKIQKHWFKREFSSLNEANYVYEKLRKTKGVAYCQLDSDQGGLKFWSDTPL